MHYLLVVKMPNFS